MSDLEELLAKFATGEFLRPSPDIPNLVDLARALAALVEARGIAATAGSLRLAERIGASDHLVFILADGLGMNLIEELPGSAFLSSHLAAELRTVFPSTTAVALTSLATGEWPSRHGVTGWWTHLPEIRAAGALLPFVSRSGSRSLTTLGITPEDAFPLPAVMGKAERDTLALFPARLAESVSSAYFSGYRARHGYRTLREAIDLIVARVSAAQQPTYTYLYTPRVDVEAHRHGIGHPRVQAALLELDGEVERLAARLAGRARLVVSADHGFLDIPVGARHRIRPSAELMASLLCPPSGDARVLYFHARDGAQQQVCEHFRDRYGEHFFLIAAQEAEALGLFGPGPVSPPVNGRLGDAIAISRGPDVIEFVAGGGPGRILASASHHSGLTPAEMRIPLVVA